MSDFAITFLGTGTSAGVPVIGCECAVCRSSDSRDKRFRTASLVETPEMVFAIDTPPDFRSQCLRAGLVRLDAVLYTHAHSDHVLGFDDLRRFCEMENKGMPIHASPSTMESLKRVFSYAFHDGPVAKTYIRPLPQEFDGPFVLGETRVVPVELPHGRYITNGFVFYRGERKVLAYYTDCHEVPPEAEAQAEGAEIFVLDALRPAQHSTHLTIEEAVEVAGRVRAKQTYFIHMCHEVSHAETQANLPPGIFLSYDTLRVEV